MFLIKSLFVSVLLFLVLKKTSNRRFFIKFPGEHWNWLTFLQPFSAELWFALAGLFTTISAFLVASYFCGIEQIVRPSSFLPGPSMLIIWGSWMGQVSVFLCFLFHGLFSCQGSWLDPKSFPSRIIFFISFLCGITIYTAYSAKLISFLSIPNIVQPFSSLQVVQ